MKFLQPGFRSLESVKTPVPNNSGSKKKRSAKSILFAHATFRMRNVATKTATGRVGNDF